MFADPAIAKVVLTPPPLVALPTSTHTPCFTLQITLPFASCHVQTVLSINALQHCLGGCQVTEPVASSLQQTYVGSQKAALLLLLRIQVLSLLLAMAAILQRFLPQTPAERGSRMSACLY